MGMKVVRTDSIVTEWTGDDARRLATPIENGNGGGFLALLAGIFIGGGVADLAASSAVENARQEARQANHATADKWESYSE